MSAAAQLEEGKEEREDPAASAPAPGAVPPAVLPLLEREDRLPPPEGLPIGLQLPEAGKLVREPLTYSSGEFGCREFDS